MGFSVIFWIQVIIALFIGIMLLIDNIRYKERTFRLLFFFYLFVLAKSLVYIFIHLADNASLNEAKLNFYYQVFQACEFIYTLMFFFIIGYYRSISQEKNIRGLAYSSSIIALVAVAILSALIYFSVKFGDSNFKTGIYIIEAFKNWLGNVLFVSGMAILLIMSWRYIAIISSSVTSQIRLISDYRRLLYIFIFIEIVFHLFSFINFSRVPQWFGVQIISLSLFSIFAFGSHTQQINTFQEKIVSLNKEKNMLIQLMKDISLVVGGEEFDLDTVIKAIVDNSVKGTAARGGVILIKDKITSRLNVGYISGLYPPTKPLRNIQNLTITENIILERLKAEKIAVGEGLLGEVAEKGQSIFIPDVDKDERFVQTVSDHIMVKSFIAVPLRTKEDVFGVLSVVDDSKFFQENDLSLLETLGDQAAITITQIQMYQEVLEKKQAEKELGVAGEIQASLIPHSFPQSERFDIYGFSIPAKGVGGDYYDYIDFGNNKVVLTMFDVSGKGVPAALIMVMIRSILRTVASLNTDTRDVIARLNNTIAEEIVEDRYATGFYLLFDAEKGIMSYTNAGHGPLILYRAATDEFEFLDTEGMPIGIMSGVEYGQSYTILEKGDIAILYTDGISEAMNMAHEEFGLDKFKEVIRVNKKEGAKELCNRVLEAVTNFAGAAPQHDDETLLVLKSK